MEKEPGKEKFLLGKRIVPRKLKKKNSVTELVNNHFQAYNAARLQESCRLLAEKMLDPKREVTIGITLAGALTPAGISGMIVSMMEHGFIDFIVSTGANLYHDTHFALNYPLHKGTWQTDDTVLWNHGVIRIYDIFLTTDTLLNTDKWTQKVLLEKGAPRGVITTSEFHHYLGQKLLRDAPHPEISILAQAAKFNVPVYTSSPGDSTYGMDLANFNKARNKEFSRKGSINLHINPNWDVVETAAIVLGAKENGVILLGGGSPKNFYLQTQPYLWECLGIEKGGHDYFIQITMDSPQWGGLCFSGFSNIILAGDKIKKAKDVKVGDKILTIDDKNNVVTTEVKKIFKRKINEGERLYIIKAEDSRVQCGDCGVTTGKKSGHKVKLTVTEDHLIFTDRGWVKAKDLAKNDKILKITQYDKIAFDRANKIPLHLRNYCFEPGEKNPFFGKIGAQNPFFGRTHSESVKQYLSALRTGKTWEELIGKKRAEALKSKYREIMKGDKNPAWAGGISWEPYAEEFFMIRSVVLERDNSSCKLCGITEKESYEKHNQHLHVHHMDFDKKNNSLKNLVSLCVSCHGKANFPKYREEWNQKLVAISAKTTGNELADCPEFLPIKEIIVYKSRKQITGCLHGEEVYDFMCYPYHNFFSDWILIHNSGATPQEAVSWGKINPDELKNTVVVYSDTTIASPILFSYAFENARPRKRKELYKKLAKLVYNLEKEVKNKAVTWTADALYEKHKHQK
ncbi:MAG: deoxyhypusine synthase family protein [Candidatus Nealsonbacteria bacterium]|nr:deoxyhypusine synthase family protein [Candidatus Nealsonbacteria bacterium]